MSAPPLSAADARSVSLLKDLLRFPTVSATGASDGSYAECGAYLVASLTAVGCFSSVSALPNSRAGSPVVVAAWRGTDASLDRILLNCHYDVVPADPENWHPLNPPFAAAERHGKIYGRGVQDMKCVCAQYIEACRRLHAAGFVPRRTIYLSFVPDEEVGGSGMECLLTSALYRDELHGRIALALDEGLASTDGSYSVFYGERLPWWISVTARGKIGHGSRFLEHTAVAKILAVCNRAMAFRAEQQDVLHGAGKHAGCSHAQAAKKTLGDVTSLNVTRLDAGVRSGDGYAYNCCPPEATVALDIRISPHTEPAAIVSMLDRWCQECNLEDAVDDISWEYLGGQGNSMAGHATTPVDPTVNPWYEVFRGAVETPDAGAGYEGIRVRPEVFPAATDSRFLRALGIRALGFSPMRNSEILLHEDDECLGVDVFLEGIGIYERVVKALASAGKEVDERFENPGVGVYTKFEDEKENNEGNKENGSGDKKSKIV